MKHIRPTPLGALARGLLAGAFGSAVQDLFFQVTGKFAPRTPKEVFTPPEREQLEESETQTIARRFMNDFLQRPISDAGKARGATVVHYAFGAALGGAYGLLRESVPALRRPAGALAFGLGAWVVGDNLVVPALKLGAWPQAYPLKTHAYAITAHLVFGAAVWGAYEAMRPRSLAAAAAALWSAQAKLALATRLPHGMRPAARAVIGKMAEVRANAPRMAVGDALRWN